jgi:hypothetical protein
MTRARFGPVSMWDDDDPAVRRSREALIRNTVVPAQEPPPAPEAPELEPEPNREHLRRLRDRVAAGDRSAAAALRDLLARLGEAR